MNAAYRLFNGALTADEDRPLFFFGDERISYRMAVDAARRFAGLLTARGIVPGDRLLLALDDSPGFATVFYGALFAGVVPVAVNPASPAEDMTFYLADSGARLVCTAAGSSAESAGQAAGLPVLVCGAFGPAMEEVQPAAVYEAPDEALGFMLYSSGSTGRPKGIPHRFGDLTGSPDSWGALLDIRPGDLVFATSKLFFAYGMLASLIVPPAFGAAAVLHPGKPGASEVLRSLTTLRPTHFFSTPTLYNLLVRLVPAGTRFPTLKRCFSAGEGLPAVLFEEWKRLTELEILDGIGSTEAFDVFIANRAGEARAGATGTPVPAWEVRIVDGEGRDVPDGEPGGLAIRGATLTTGYWNRPDKTAASFLADGFMRTGDVFVRRGGVYWCLGRSDDMIKVGGEYVSPTAVEEALLRLPAVCEAAVVEKRVGGLSRMVAYVVLSPEIEPAPEAGRALLNELASRVPAKMRPDRVVFVEEIPKTPTGKVTRYTLRERAEEASGPVDAAFLGRLLVQVGVDAALVAGLDPHVSLVEQGVDSMDYPSFLLEIEATLGRSIPDEAAVGLKTLNDFVAALNQPKGGARA